jgi:hypothetical protein
VANYNTGDGIEKAFMLANILHERHPDKRVRVDIDGRVAGVKAEKEYMFTTTKELEQQIEISPDGIEVSR